MSIALDISKKDSIGLINSYERIVLLTDEFSTPFFAKTATSLLRYRHADVVAVLDVAETGKAAQELFGVGDKIPVVASLDELDADAVFLGTASAGGKLPVAWTGIIQDALARGIEIVSGMHDFLSDNVEFSRLADQNGCHLIDVRRNDEHVTSIGKPFREWLPPYPHGWSRLSPRQDGRQS